MNAHVRQESESESAGPVLVARRTMFFVLIGDLVVSLPSVVLSGWLIWGLSALVGDWLVVVAALVWPVSGACVLLVGVLISGATAQASRSASPEHAEVVAAWAVVAAVARIDESRYMPWVHDVARVNGEVYGYATLGGHVVVTRHAVDVFTRGELQAVLAHELGHQLLGQMWLRWLIKWYRGPADLLFALAVGVVSKVVSLLQVGPRWIAHRLYRGPRPVILLGVLVVAIVPTAAVLGSGWAILAVSTRFLGLPTALVVVVVLAAQPLARARLSQWQEYGADRVAVKLGYGQDLRGVLRRLQADWDATPVEQRLLTRLIHTHPSPDSRRRAVEALEPQRHTATADDQPS
ncbi:M48 family metallopeptidase [Nocardia sp. XZ_19_231]|uniref:M48 family metallopeptidase n=1 Tax=Nocardia sp. XZ_19_231 TaxID=2769252 RepID=UPI00188F58E5|nr:M48 family metalloprotease [Nocardia sp. XZ_19_231]